MRTTLLPVLISLVVGCDDSSPSLPQDAPGTETDAPASDAADTDAAPSAFSFFISSTGNANSATFGEARPMPTGSPAPTSSAGRWQPPRSPPLGRGNGART